MGIFGKKKALIQQLQNAVALQNAQIAQLQENNEHLKQELESLRSSIPKEQKDFEILAEKSKGNTAQRLCGRCVVKFFVK